MSEIETSEIEASGTIAPDVTPDTQTKDAPAEDVAKNAAPSSKKADPAPAQEHNSKEESKQFKIKVNGKERLVDEKTAIAYLQRELAADEKFRQASAEAKRIEAIIKAAKEDPDKFFRELTGLDPLEYSKKRIGDEIKRMAMTPEQRELEEYKAKVAAFEKKERERIAAEQRASQERAKEFYIKKYDTEIPDALKAAGLPVNEDTVRYTAEVMIANLEEGLDLPYEMVMDLVKDKYQKSFKGFFESSDKERLLELLGEDFVDALAEIKARKKNPPKQRPTQAIQSESGSEDDPRTMNQEQFREYVRRWSKQ